MKFLTLLAILIALTATSFAGDCEHDDCDGINSCDNCTCEDTDAESVEDCACNGTIEDCTSDCCECEECDGTVVSEEKASTTHNYGCESCDS